MPGSETHMNDQGFLKRILLVVDGTQSADTAAEFAFRLAGKLQNELIAVYTIDTGTMDYLLQTHIFVSDEREEFENALEEKGRNYLERTARLGKACGISVQTQILKGRFHDSVLQFARQNEIGAIIIGGWGENSIHDKNTFSVERRRIMELAKCPIFVIKGEKPQS